MFSPVTQTRTENLATLLDIYRCLSELSHYVSFVCRATLAYRQTLTFLVSDGVVTRRLVRFFICYSIQPLMFYRHFSELRKHLQHRCTINDLKY